MTVQSVEVQGASQLRTSFLRAQTADIFDQQHTLPSLLSALEASALRLNRLGIYKDAKFSIELADSLPGTEAGKTLAAGKPLDLKATLSGSRTCPTPISIKTIVQDDLAGVSAIGAFTNLFGGAEKLTVSVAQDTSAVSARALKNWYVDLSAPIQANPDLQAHFAAFGQNKDNFWASHRSALQGVTAKVVNASAQYPGSFFEAGIEAVQRSVTSVGDDASESVKALDQTENNKASIFTRVAVDRRDNPIYPTTGYTFDLQSELAGVIGGNALKSDVSHLKSVGTASIHKSLDPKNNNLVFSASVGSGLLWTYNNNRTSSIHDRFFLGGKASGLNAFLYGYKANALGPQDGSDRVGGDAFTLGNISLTGKLPHLASTHPLSPLRFLVFFSGASLSSVTSETSSFKEALLGSTEPSTCAGAGLLYKAYGADLELVYGVPLHSSRPEDNWTKRGVQVSVGLEL